MNAPLSERRGNSVCHLVSLFPPPVSLLRLTQNPRLLTLHVSRCVEVPPPHQAIQQLSVSLSDLPRAGVRAHGWGVPFYRTRPPSDATGKPRLSSPVLLTTRLSIRDSDNPLLGSDSYAGEAHRAQGDSSQVLSRVWWRIQMSSQMKGSVGRLWSGRVLSTVLMELGCITLPVWKWSTFWKLSKPQCSWDFMEVFSQRHDPSLTPPSALPSLQDGGDVGLKLPSS